MPSLLTTLSVACESDPPCLVLCCVPCFSQTSQSSPCHFRLQLSDENSGQRDRHLPSPRFGHSVQQSPHPQIWIQPRCGDCRLLRARSGASLFSPRPLTTWCESAFPPKISPACSHQLGSLPVRPHCDLQQSRARRPEPAAQVSNFRWVRHLFTKHSFKKRDVSESKSKMHVCKSFCWKIVLPLKWKTERQSFYETHFPPECRSAPDERKCFALLSPLIKRRGLFVQLILKLMHQHRHLILSWDDKGVRVLEETLTPSMPRGKVTNAIR